MGESRKFCKTSLFLLLLCFLVILITSPLFGKETEDSLPKATDTQQLISESNSVTGKADEKPESIDSVNEESDASVALFMSTPSQENEGAAASLLTPVINVSSFTGAATARIPIVVPPGRNGLAPRLSLNYISQQKNGWIGVGWSLDAGSIRRSIKQGVNYDADEYVVFKDGRTAELIPRTDWGTNYYGAKIEGEFTKYENKQDNGWEVTAKDGTKFFYGTTAASRQTDPDASSRVFNWCLDRVEDTNGNYMSITYEKQPDGVYEGQIYLERIDYTGNGSLSPRNYIKFYLESRPDTPVMFTTNFKVLTAKRLKTLEIQTLDGLARAYKFEYTESGSTRQSLLNSVQQFGVDAEIDPEGNITGATSLPAMIFTYQAEPNGSFTPGPSGGMTTTYAARYPGDYNGDGKMDVLLVKSRNGAAFVKLSNGDGSFTSGPSGDMTTTYTARYPGDYNGDGKMDVLLVKDRNGAAFVKLSNGDGSFTAGPRQDMTQGYNTRYTGDYDGDGKTDILLVKKDNGAARVRLSNGDGSFTWGPFEDMTQGYNTRYTGDYDGDGKTDILLVKKDNGAARVRFSNGDGSFAWGPFEDMTQSYSDRYTGDYNGDGKTDILLVKKDNGAARVKFSNGDGSFAWGPFEDMTQSYSDRYTGDYNGDGKTDILLVRESDSSAVVRLSNGDGSFATGPSESMIQDYNTRYIGDYSGDGKTDVLLVKDSNGSAFAKLSNGLSPHLLATFSNGLGGTTTVKYTPTSEYQNTLLPFILHNVSEVVFDDGNPFGIQTTIGYNYSGGLFDFETWEFRGFETVTQTNAVGTPYETITETKFHQDEYRKDRQYQVELKEPGESGALLSKTTLIWNSVFLDPPDNTCAFVKLQQKMTEHYDDVTVTIQEVNTYDDTNGNLLSKTTSGTDGEDVTVNYQYSNLGDWMWRNTQETLKNESQQVVRETFFQYWDDGTGNLRFKEFRLDGQPTNPKIEMTYDIYGNQTTVIDAIGNPSTTDYDTDTHTYPVKTTYPETNGVAHIVENEDWDYRFGKVAITKDENGNRTYYDYDEFGRPVQVDSSNGGQVTTEYHDEVFPSPRYVVTKVKENTSGNTINSYRYFDGFGREIQRITLGEAGKAIVTKLFYDELGRNDLVEGPFFESSRNYAANPPTHSDYPLNPSGGYPWQQTTFDLRGRPVELESADGEYGSVVASFSYSGLSSTATDPDGGSKTEIKDYLGRVIQVIEHADGADYTTGYTYNAAGDLLTVNDQYNNTTTVNYDTLGRKLNMIDPDMGYWEYTYDPNGNLLTQTDEKLQTVTFAYDELNRVTSKTYSTSDPTATYVYDNLSIPNGRGRLYTVSNTQATITYNAYDELGNVTSVSKTIAGDAIVYTTQYEYDLSGKVTKTIYPDGYQVSNAFYAGTGLLHTVTGSDAVEYANLSDYEPTGKMGQIEHANGILTTYSYDPESTRLTSIVTTNPGPTIDLQNKSYRYTGAGDIKEITDDVKSITFNYTYDKLHRLKTETNTGAYDPISYTYNAIGNIMSKTVGSTTLAYTYDTWHKHAVKTINFNGNDHHYSYDDNGNMTGGPDFSDPAQMGTRTIAYNADNRPTSITHVKGGNTVTTDFIYGGNGVRSKKSIQGGSTTYYIGEHYEIKDGAATKFIFAGNLRVAMVAGSSVSYFHKDHLGSSTVMTDATGAAVETTDYMPFGSQRDHTGTDVSDYKFTDQEFDAETGLYNYNARLYDPVIGRFISADSIVPDPFDPQSLNRYAYCQNNPLIYVDPTGHYMDDGAFDGVEESDFDGFDAFGDSDTNSTYARHQEREEKNENAPFSGGSFVFTYDRGDIEEAGFFSDPLSLVRDVWDILESLDKARLNKVEDEAKRMQNIITAIDKKYKQQRNEKFNKECDIINTLEARKKCYDYYQKEYQSSRNKKLAPYIEKFNLLMGIVNQRPVNERVHY